MRGSGRTVLLPRITDWDGYRRAFRKRRLWIPAVRAILARHGFRALTVSAVLPGTSAAFLVATSRGRILVKIFPPFPSDDAGTEVAALGLIHARTTVPVPGFVAAGSLCDRVRWKYLILRPLPGDPLTVVIGRVSRPALQRIAETAGRMLRQVNSIKGRDLVRLPPGRRQFRFRVAGFLSTSLAVLARSGSLSPALARRLPRLLRALTRPEGRPVLLHADFNADHVMVARIGGNWRVTGLIDLGDAAAGDPSYELMPVWLGLACVSPPDGKAGRAPTLLALAVFNAFMRGYAPGLNRSTHWRDRSAAFILAHQFTPLCLPGLVRGRRFTSWTQLRDLLIPPL
jgi:aminoglycoside phosphotransferase (APT) family kinase protein